MSARAKPASAFSYRNYRIFFVGQLVSVIGTWMQGTAQLLYLQFVLKADGTHLGWMSSAQFLPILMFGLWAGGIADRVDRRKLLMAVQLYMGVVAFAQMLLIVTGHATYWWFLALGAALGIGNMFDMPARQSFASEMVAREALPNAVGVNSAIFNGARVVGPAISGVVVSTLGYSWAFGINAASFLAITAAYWIMRTDELFVLPRARRGSDAVRDGLRYVRDTPVLRTVLLCVLIAGTLALNFQIFLPMMAKRVFNGNTATVVSFQTALGVGAFTGALLVARRRQPTGRLFAVASALFGIGLLGLSYSGAAWQARIWCAFLGMSFITFMLVANATLQLASNPEMRGRVMAVYGLVFAGTTPIGAPIVGSVADQFGVRTSVRLGAIAVFATCALAMWSITRGHLPLGGPTPAASPLALEG